MKQAKINLNKEDWQKDYDAGRRREPHLPPEEVEVLSWHSATSKVMPDAYRERTTMKSVGQSPGKKHSTRLRTPKKQ